MDDDRTRYDEDFNFGHLNDVGPWWGSKYIAGAIVLTTLFGCAAAMAYDYGWWDPSPKSGGHSAVAPLQNKLQGP